MIVFIKSTLSLHDYLLSVSPRFHCMERYDPACDTWTIVANLSIGRDAIGQHEGGLHIEGLFKT